MEGRPTHRAFESPPSPPLPLVLELSRTFQRWELLRLLGRWLIVSKAGKAGWREWEWTFGRLPLTFGTADFCFSPACVRTVHLSERNRQLRASLLWRRWKATRSLGDAY